MKSKIFSAVVVFTGTVVGAGIFGIPYVIAQVGFGVGLFYLIALGVLALITVLCYGEVILRTKKFHQATGYARKYLGRWGKLVMSFSLTFGVYGALLAYMIGVGDFAYTLLGSTLGGSPVLYTTIFFVLASIAILLGLGLIVKIEKGMIIALVAVVAFFLLIGIKHIEVRNFAGFELSNIFLPYGVVLFAFFGLSAIPDMSRLLKKEPAKLKKSLVIGTIFVFIIYLTFSLVIVGISGQDTTEEAVDGLRPFLGNSVVIIGAIFGILAMTTSFLTLGLSLKEMYSYDYSVNKTLAWVLTCFVPFIVFILGLSDFVEVLGIVGGVTGGISGIMVIKMYERAKKIGDKEPSYSIEVPKIALCLMYAIFAFGIIYQIYYLITE